MRRIRPLLAAAALLAGCGPLAVGPFRPKHQAIVQSDLRLPRGTRVAVIPPTLYGYAKEQRLTVLNAAYSSLTASLLKQGFHVIERSLVEKAVQDYGQKKTYDKTPGVGAAVYQENNDEDSDKVVDVVEIGKTLNSRLVAAGSLQYNAKMLSSGVEVRMRMIDVTTGEMISHCHAAGKMPVLEGCADSMALELSQKMTGGVVAPNFKVNLQ